MVDDPNQHEPDNERSRLTPLLTMILEIGGARLGPLVLFAMILYSPPAAHLASIALTLAQAEQWVQFWVYVGLLMLMGVVALALHFGMYRRMELENAALRSQLDLSNARLLSVVEHEEETSAKGEAPKLLEMREADK